MARTRVHSAAGFDWLIARKVRRAVLVGEFALPSLSASSRSVLCHPCVISPAWHLKNCMKGHPARQNPALQSAAWMHACFFFQSYFVFWTVCAPHVPFFVLRYLCVQPVSIVVALDAPRLAVDNNKSEGVNAPPSLLSSLRLFIIIVLHIPFFGRDIATKTTPPLPFLCRRRLSSFPPAPFHSLYCYISMVPLFVEGPLLVFFTCE